LLVATTSLASAADLAARPYAPPVAAAVYNWAGFHLGVNGGYGWANTDITGLPASIPGIGTIPALGSKLNGGFAGGQLGYDWQVSSGWVVGLEADAQWADLSNRHGHRSGGGILAAAAY
jgi:outer membrane immunogenic protein